MSLSSDKWDVHLSNVVYDTRKPLYLTIEEHYCYDIRSVVPADFEKNGIKNAWLPEDLVVRKTGVGYFLFCSKFVISSFRLACLFLFIRTVWSSQTARGPFRLRMVHMVVRVKGFSMDKGQSWTSS